MWPGHSYSILHKDVDFSICFVKGKLHQSFDAVHVALKHMRHDYHLVPR
jgi:hypothetical protein